MPIFWGDLHNHCGISYGYGSLENALAAARGHLDFCAVTGHAMWHDMYPLQPETEFVVGFHRRGFAKLAAQWDQVRQVVESANEPGEFVTFHTYEAHSSEFGDHHILSPSPELPLLDAAAPAALMDLLQVPAIAVPHHIAYAPGYRGINWDAYAPDISPVVEIYSKHGCGLRDDGPYPYLHTMGPRDGRNTAEAGLKGGHHFGFVASTDHHAGFPGSYGDGRVAVLAQAKTREAIWEALQARRCYAVTGDKIRCQMELDGAPMGGVAPASERAVLSLDVSGSDRLDQVVICQNARPWRTLAGEELCGKAPADRFKVRLEMGWGRSSDPYLWQGTARAADGAIVGVEGCFRGVSRLAPSAELADDPGVNALRNGILVRSAGEVAWECTSFANVSTLHPQTASVVLEIEGDARTELVVEANGVRLSQTVGQLCARGIAQHTRPWASEALLLHRAVPARAYCFSQSWDLGRSEPGDTWYVEIRQANGQYAWLSPVWIGSAG